jgi:predicted HicB family RNase H-like nuclease
MQQFVLQPKSQVSPTPRHFSGKFILRIYPGLHERIAIAAESQGERINTLAQEALQERVAS